MKDFFLRERRSGANKRSVVRLPIERKKEAIIFNEGFPPRIVPIIDLSTGGISFMIEGPLDIPDTLKIKFKPSFFSSPLLLDIEVANKYPADKGLRVGCRFVNIDEKTRRALERYICGMVDFTGVSSIISFASALVFVDATIRTLIYFLNLYFSATAFGRPYYKDMDLLWYGITILSYLTLSLSAFLMKTEIIDKRSKARFFITILLLSGTLFFLLPKAIMFYNNPMGGAPPVADFYFAELYAGLFVFFSIIFGAASSRRINLIVNSVEGYRYTGPMQSTNKET